jgi:hypothetical protein
MFKLVKISYMAEETPKQPAPQQPKKMHAVKRFFRRILYFFILLFILIGIGTYVYFNYTYSEGYRTGVLVKFSHRGFIKTYEGELDLGSISLIPGNTLANNRWRFSVRDGDVAKKLMRMEGKTVRLHYQEKVKSFFWQGETNYFVDEVQEIK